MYKYFLPIFLIASTWTPHGWSQTRFTTAVDFDGLGQTSHLIYPDGSRTTYAYASETGTPTGVSYHHAAGGNDYQMVDNVVFGAQGRVTSARLGSGVLDRTFDDLDRLASLKFSLGGSVLYHALDMTYNRWGTLAGFRWMSCSHVKS